nr:hypothetical protein [Tanacetum cinerariifolium]
VGRWLRWSIQLIAAGISTWRLPIGGSKNLCAGNTRPSPRVPSKLDNRNTTLLQPFDFTVHDLYRKIQKIFLTRFPAQSVGSSKTVILDSPCLLVLITGTSQSRQHGKSESDSYYLSD